MEAVKERIIAWLAEEDFQVKVETPPKDAPVNWILRVVSKVPANVNIILQQPRGREETIIASLGVMISDEHLRGMQRLNEKERAKLVYETVRDLALMCPDCLIIIQPSVIDLRRILITKTLYTESLTREALARSLRTLANMFTLLSLKLTSAFGPFTARRPQQDTTMGFM